MIALKKIWIAFSIVALSSFVVVPAVVAADVPGFQNSGPSTQDNGPGTQAGGPGAQNSGPSTQAGGPGMQNGGPSTQSSNPGGFQNSGPTTQNSGTNVGPGGLNNPLGNVTGLCQLLKIVLNVLILIGIPIAMFFLVYAGFKLVFARGRPTELEAAKRNLFNTIIGIAIFLGVWFIVQVIANTLGALGVQILGDCH